MATFFKLQFRDPYYKTHKHTCRDLLVMTMFC